MPDKKITYGLPGGSAEYQSGDDDPTGGGNFVVAERLDSNGDPVDVLLEWDEAAGEWQYGGPVNLSGEDVTNVGAFDADSVNTGALDFDGSTFVSAGDFVGLYSMGVEQLRSFDTTSTTYDFSLDQLNEWFVWDDIVPSGGQGAVIFNGFVNEGFSETVDVRLRNTFDDEVIAEITSVDGGFGSGAVNYTPATTASPIRIVAEIQTSPGDNTSTLVSPNAVVGVQL